jgi:thiol-disulfide isomerase/thioredoxin
MKKRYPLLFIGLFCLQVITLAQPYTLKVEIKNHPFNSVVIGKIKGDHITGADTVATQNLLAAKGPLKLISYNFPSDAQPGMYRMVFGQTTYAKVMDEPPQQLDFIFNNEHIRFLTDFKAPADSLQIISSDENKTWFTFLKQEAEYRQKLKELEMEVNYFQTRAAEPIQDMATGGNTGMEEKAASVANSFNVMQMERERLISNSIDANEGLFAARLIKMFHEPFRDGYYSAAERNTLWQDNYFRYTDFSDEALINSSLLTDRIFSYLVTYNQKDFSHEQRERAYIKAVNAVMQKIENDAGKGGAVYEFVLDYLIDGFEGLKMTNVLAWMADKYSDSLCESEEKTTLRRKMEAQKMKPGSAVPDFTLNDLTGKPVVFSEVLKKRNLLIFWASWCPHCIDILPKVKTLCGGKNDLEVVAVALDKSGDEWHKAVYKAGIEQFINLSDLMEWDGRAAEDYNVYATPTMFIVDSNLKLLEKPFNLEELSKSLKNY